MAELTKFLLRSLVVWTVLFLLLAILFPFLGDFISWWNMDELVLLMSLISSFLGFTLMLLGLFVISSMHTSGTKIREILSVNLPIFAVALCLIEKSWGASIGFAIISATVLYLNFQVPKEEKQTDDQ